ncbi:CD44 antigen isoform X5 [Nannospalax galili]|uniref:CD44 antigen isoform X5 n=1 Tax=Nannospalax galili TaxID=1026970 RepID=UPI00111C6594|nr:CD44 antigen isoform X5 [Nannospalax galili]
MGKFWWHAAWGLCLLQLSLAQQQIDLNITCRYAGVFHVEKNGRYSISRTEAADLCQAFNSTLPTMDQMKLALNKGFETCRYGFIEGHVVIPRITPNAICAANHTGVYILTSNTSHYDTYCFNASAPLEEDCTSVTDLPNSFDGLVTITIVNRDGTRYSKKGEYRTHPEDLDPKNNIDEDMSSGSSSEKSTSGSYIFHTHLPTMHPTQEDDDIWFSRSTPVTSTESNTISTGWQPNEENEDEREKYVSFSGSGIDDDEDFITSTISSTPRVSDHTKQNQDWTQWRPSPSNPEVLLQTTNRITDVDRNSTIAHGENQTQEPQPPFIHHEHQDEEETPQAPSSTWATPSRTTEETATQKDKWFGNGWHGRYPQTPSEDSHATAGTTAASVHNHPSQRMTTQSQEDVSWTDFFNPISHPMGQGHQTERMGDTDAGRDPSGGSHTVTQGYESAGHSSGSQEGGVNTTSGPVRKPQIPEWLIILASLLALALILAVCIAVNSRRRCGQKKKLVINSGNGTVEDRKPSELNGEASKSQEMVHLVNKEPSETPDQFMTADETRNLQNVDMKIGV